MEKKKKMGIFRSLDIFGKWGFYAPLKCLYSYKDYVCVNVWLNVSFRVYNCEGRMAEE